MSKVKDGIIGHAIGDAMGVPVEFCTREDLLKNPVTDMIGYGSYDVPKGSWSDDTSMEICLMKSIIDKGMLDYDDIMNNFIKWIENGDFTATGEIFDIGRTCLKAVRNYIDNKTKAVESGIDSLKSNGNGSLMRILPVAYYSYYKKLKNDEIYELVKNVSSLTHRHEISILGCYIYVLYVIKLLEGKDKFASYNMIKLVDYSKFSNESLESYKRILKDDIKKCSVVEINSSGYIVDTLEASLWVLLNAKDYKEAIIGAINLGGDTDTIGAITGSMAGIVYGYDDIPKLWLDKLMKRDYLENLCEEFEEIFNSQSDSSFKIINSSSVEQDVDAIVNAANKKLISGGGVCGAIFEKAGYKELNEACSKIKTPLNNGDAVITPSFNIDNCKYIIHAVGPTFTHNPNATKEIFNAYYNSLKVLKDNNLHSVSFPLISSGIFGYGIENPVGISTKQCKLAYQKFRKDYPNYQIRVLLCAYTKDEYEKAIGKEN